jgi:AcrR family transcriptional regulator
MPAAQSPASADDTPARLLDAAERLFAELGYDGVGLRALTTAAGVNLGAATYHFGSKESLYIEALLRRLRPMNVRRVAQLDAAEKKHGVDRVPLAVVLDCLLREPLATTRAHPSFLRLLARSLFTMPPFLLEPLGREMMPFDQRVFSHLLRIYPALTRDEAFQILNHCVGPLFFTASNPFAPLTLKGPASVEHALRDLVQFCAAGVAARARDAKKRKRP